MHLGVLLRRNTLRRENTTLLRADRSGPWFRGTFHGPTVIAHPSAREKLPGRENQRASTALAQRTGQEESAKQHGADSGQRGA
jgi:hypothetical protein